MNKDTIYSAMEMRELAKVCTYETFVSILRRHHMIYDKADGEWIDFEWTLGRRTFISSIGYDYRGTPYLSDYIQSIDPYADDYEDEYCLGIIQYFKQQQTT